MDVTPALQALNNHLRSGGHRCRIEQRRSALYLRATLPERDNPGQRRQQRIPLGLAATLTSIPEAERLAMELGRQLREGSFTWQGWTHETHQESLTPAAFRDHATQLMASLSAKRGLAVWEPALRKLPTSGEITPAVLLQVIEGLPPESAVRRDQGGVLAQIAGTLGWDADILRRASQGYGRRHAKPRSIPEDDEIVSIYHRLRRPHWRWAWGMLATFGLRPHELSEVEWAGPRWVRVAVGTKTGDRLVTACPSRWIEEFALGEVVRPWQPAGRIAQALNQYVSQQGIRCPAYNLRHAYALRLMQQAVPPEYGARLMGHSLQIHEATYKRWLDAERISQAMERFDL